MKLVGRYQIQARIGQGAMANVYRAYDPDIHRELAIKVLKREYVRNPEFAQRFLREARAAGALSHPNIVTIYDVGEIEGFPYIAMELLEGAPLDQAAKGLPVPIANVLEIGVQLADALRYAHAQGIVHRDIKPSNVVLGADGRSIKILDFGIARCAAADVGAQDELLKTQLGQVLGTPRYMSPEQALGRELDGRSDLFSAGVLLYELITGHPAFSGASAATLALQITQQDPAPIDVTPECPSGLKFIISKLLAKRPDKRFANGEAFLVAIQRERAAYHAAADESARKRAPLYVRLGLAATAIMASVLFVGIGTVVDNQYRAMERVAITSGSSIVSFVASNAALPAVENSILPEEQRDWLPVQAFINSAGADPNVTQLTVVDHAGVIRAASDSGLIGAQYIAPNGRRIVAENSNISVTTVRDSSGVESFRFAKPIMYAAQQVGLVDISVRKTELQAAAALSRNWLIGLGLLIIAIVAALSIAGAHLLARPVRLLRAALRDAVAGNLDFRLSHKRRDEFGELFDGFNALMASLQERFEARHAPPENVNATIISAPANDIETPQAASARPA